MGLTEEREKECGGDGSGSRLKVFTPVAVGRKVLKEAGVTLSGHGSKLIHTSRQELLVIKSGRIGEGAEGPAETLRRRHGQDLVTEPEVSPGRAGVTSTKFGMEHQESARGHVSFRHLDTYLGKDKCMGFGGDFRAGCNEHRLWDFTLTSHSQEPASLEETADPQAEPG